MNALDNTVTCVLAGKSRTLREPVFKDLKRVLYSYNALATANTEQERARHFIELLTVFFGKKAVSLTHITSQEAVDFLSAIPAACGLEKTTATTKEKDTGLDFVYSHLAACFGFSYDYVDNNMTMSRLKTYQHYWESHPPTHLLVASFLGYEKKEQDSLHSFFSGLRARFGLK
jgi:hypothetical protein